MIIHLLKTKFDYMKHLINELIGKMKNISTVIKSMITTTIVAAVHLALR